jgi:hypothetical protein
MSGFSAEWLTLREPFDVHARNSNVLDRVAAAFAHLPSISVVDLACGTGSTRRAIASRLHSLQRWRMVDNDLSLLARIDSGQTAGGSSVSVIPVDLAHDVEAALDGAIDLVATSSLLDLVSAEWLERLVTEIAARRLPFYAALTYNGRNELTPAHPYDATLFAAFNRDQETDKGFGVALGPHAAAALVAQCRRVGYEVVEGISNWSIGPSDRAMMLALLEGWTSAARRTQTIADSEALGWHAQRSALADAGKLAMSVGHVDVFAFPTGPL